MSKAKKPQPKTIMIGVREFRSNMTKLIEDSQKKNLTYIVTHHGKPISKVSPLSIATGKDGYDFEDFLFGIHESLGQIQKGETNTLKQVKKMLDL